MISGDCENHVVCITELFSNGFCNVQNNSPDCDFDGGDCNCNPFIHDGICDPENNNLNCEFDNGDCLEVKNECEDYDHWIGKVTFGHFW